MDIKEQMEKYKLTHNYLSNNGRNYFAHPKYEVIEEGEDYIISAWYEKEEVCNYIIFYKIYNKVFYTKVDVEELSEGHAVLKTVLKRYEYPEDKRLEIKAVNVFLNYETLELTMKAKMIDFLDKFISFISKIDSVRLRNITGNFNWYFADSVRRTSYASLSLSLYF